MPFPRPENWRRAVRICCKSRVRPSSRIFPPICAKNAVFCTDPRAVLLSGGCALARSGTFHGSLSRPGGHSWRFLCAQLCSAWWYLSPCPTRVLQPGGHFLRFFCAQLCSAFSNFPARARAVGAHFLAAGAAEERGNKRSQKREKTPQHRD